MEQIATSDVHRSCAEEALRMLQGTQLGGQIVPLSWGRSPASKQPQVEQSQYNDGGYYGYGQGYKTYGYGPVAQDPTAMYYGGYPGYGGYPQVQQLPQTQQQPQQHQITLDEKSLSTELKITNTDKKPFSFTTALHTYFSASTSGASVRGLKGCKTLNKDPDPKNPVEGKEERDAVTYPGFVDCVYLGAPNELYLDNGLGDVISIKNTNWPDAVLWNPHLTMEACYKDFVYVENTQIGSVDLEPEKSWVATQQLTVG